MFQIGAPSLVHRLPYRSSGKGAPRHLELTIERVPYRLIHRASSRHPLPVILATADLQGREPAGANRLLGERLADEIRLLQSSGSLPAIDLALLCGDFYDDPLLRGKGATGEVAPALDALAALASQTRVVLGNHDTLQHPPIHPTLRILDGSVERLDPWSLSVGGVSGIIGSPTRNQRKTETDFLAAIERCCDHGPDLLLLHQGPERPSTHASPQPRPILETLRLRSVPFILFGHRHWPEPFFTEGRSLYANVHERVLVLIPDAVSTRPP